MHIYGLKNCDTCRKARAFYGADKVIDVRETPIPDALLDQAIAQFGDSIINKASKTWREISDGDKNLDAPTMIRAFPSVMKRPLIVNENGDLLLGFKPA